MRLSKHDVKLFSRPEVLFMPVVVFVLYTCPLIYCVITTSAGSFWTEFKDCLWVMFLWGGTATLFAFYFVVVFFVARKQKREGDVL